MIANILIESTKDHRLRWDKYDYYVRWSEHIQEDIKRGWSSWNYGQGGFEGTQQQLRDYLDSIHENSSADISYMELYYDDIQKIDIIPMGRSFWADDNTIYIGELYKDYWVVIDTQNAKDGLSGHLVDDELKSLKETIEKVEQHGYYDGGGFGDVIDADSAKVIYSSDIGYHVLEVSK